MKFALAVSLFFSCLACQSAEDDGEFKPLFNDKDLAGWVNVNTAPSTWRVENNMLICSGKPIGEIRTERMYQNFVLELEWRHMKPKGNAGVFVWADDITAKGQPFHRGIEVQVLENDYGKSDWFTTHGDIFPIHGAKMEPVNGRNNGSRAFPTEERSKPSPNWNQYRIECMDGDISLAVNGKVVTRGTNCSPRKGYLCLESEGGIVHYRNVRIKELPDSPIEPEHVAIANRGYRCLYSGVDLSGWKSNQQENTGWKSRDWVLHYEGDSDEVLSSSESFTNIGFIFDVQRKDDSKATFEIAGQSISIRSEPGKWHRYEGTIDDGKVSIELNGKETIEATRVADSGPVRVGANAATDFANIYVRALR